MGDNLNILILILQLLTMFIVFIICAFAMRIKKEDEALAKVIQSLITGIDLATEGIDIILERLEMEDRLPEPDEEELPFTPDEDSLYYDKSTGLFNYQSYAKNIKKQAEKANKTIEWEGLN